MMQQGLYADIPEHEYHSDPCAQPSLSASVAKTLILRSAAHAYLEHPSLGGQRSEPTTTMDRGTLIHALLLGKGRKIAVVPFDDWKKKDARVMRAEARAQGMIAVTASLFSEAKAAARELKPRLRDKGFTLSGIAEESMFWSVTSSAGDVVHCRARMDHRDGGEVQDLKITEDASPQAVRRQIVAMGYDIQGAAYTTGLEVAAPEFRGRTRFTLLFCEPFAPFSVTVVRFAGSMRELGHRKWSRAVDVWGECLRTQQWPDYTGNQVVLAEARPWELDEVAA